MRIHQFGEKTVSDYRDVPDYQGVGLRRFHCSKNNTYLNSNLPISQSAPINPVMQILAPLVGSQL